MNIQHETGKRFTYTENGITAHLDYSDHNGIRTITHTIVPTELGGRGIGTQLARAALDDASVQNLRIRSLCSFIDHFVSKETQYQDLLV
ncbi:GNAT family N-acetyltransferase [Neisseriaceae bacterium B1]